MGCEYSESETDGMDMPQKRPKQSSTAFSLAKLPAWGEPASSDSFQWPTKEDIDAMSDKDFILKSITFRSCNDGPNLGICSVQVHLSNEESSPEFKVAGIRGITVGKITMPGDKSVVEEVKAYSDD